MGYTLDIEHRTLDIEQKTPPSAQGRKRCKLTSAVPPWLTRHFSATPRPLWRETIISLCWITGRKPGRVYLGRLIIKDQ